MSKPGQADEHGIQKNLSSRIAPYAIIIMSRAHKLAAQQEAFLKYARC